MNIRASTTEASIANTVIFDLVNTKPIKAVIILVRADAAMTKKAIMRGIVPPIPFVDGFIHRI